MKVKTNLTPHELDLVSKGLSVLAKRQIEKPIVLENAAEKALLSEADELFETMVDSLQTEISHIVKK